MEKNVLIVLIIAGLALLVWVPAIIWSVRRVLRKNQLAGNAGNNAGVRQVRSNFGSDIK